MSKQLFNAIYKPVFSTKARYIDIWGGRGRGGSHFATDYFLFLLTQPNYFRGYFMRSIFGDIRESLFRDFKDRLEDSEFNEADFHINETAMTITYKNGNSIHSKGFKKASSKQTAKLKSIAGATHIIIEECEEVEEDEFMKLDDSLRTTKSATIQIFRLFNPPKKNHWIIKNFYNLQESNLPDEKGYFYATPKDRPNFLSIFSTYLHNLENVNSTTIENFESYRFKNPDYYFTTVKGLVSEGSKGRIYRDWKPISVKDYNALDLNIYHGLDFGYSNDPNALIQVKAKGNRRYIRQLIYQKGMSNAELAERCRALRIAKSEIFADSAEPKSIAELINLGINVKPALKGQDSVNSGIKHIQSLEVYYCEDSLNLIQEYEDYKWQLDANKEPTDRPEDANNHICDGFRYAETKRFRNNSVNYYE